ncbi:MAG: ABC transporter permease [Deltaproteobacteria bacterium]|uniref:ABC transporter permease n=1 Tax=Candidatus Zymogenus saltonus TaxID=2844893 RepID=A0A9D8PRL2_9DELT|nr:ABC transporter permease [Candidatus Zymogenus saltonus]
MEDGRYLIIKLAWRNIWRNKRRTIITVSAVVFAVTLSIFSWCFAVGEHEQMIDNTLKIHTGNLQVHDLGYWDDKTIYKSFAPPEELISFLDNDKRIEAYVRRLNVDALISSGADTDGVLLIGVEPERELKFSSIEKKKFRGEYLKPGDLEGIFLGETLAKNLNVDVGDKIVVICQDFYGGISAEVYNLTGTFRSGSPEMDRSMAFINLAAVQYLLSMEGRVSEVSLFLSESRALKKVARDIKGIVDLEEYEVMTWDELLPELVQVIELDNVFGYIFFGMIMLVVIFGILNTILMSVMERYREFGVMMALGTKPANLVRLILTESFFIAVLGVIVGNILGFAIAYYYTVVPFDLSSYSASLETFGMDPYIYTKIYVWVFLLTDIIIVLSTLLSALYPAIKASRLKPVRALRYV